MAQPLSQPPKNNSRAQLSPSNYAFLSCASLPHSHIHMYTFSHVHTHAITPLHMCTYAHRDTQAYTCTQHTHIYA